MCHIVAIETDIRNAHNGKGGTLGTGAGVCESLSKSLHVLLTNRLKPAYAAYKTLGRVPKNAPLFESTAKGYPIIHTGELYCRAPGGESSRPCGRVLSSKEHLLGHLEKIHGASKTHRHPGKMGCIGKAEYPELARK